jgi:hypothetical protein
MNVPGGRAREVLGQRAAQWPPVAMLVTAIAATIRSLEARAPLLREADIR